MNESRYVITGWNEKLNRAENWTNSGFGLTKPEVISLYQSLLKNDLFGKLKISKLCDVVTVYDLKD